MIRAWADWFRGLSTFQKAFPATFVAFYWITLRALHGFRGDHLVMGLGLLALCYGGRWARVVLTFALPVLLTGIVYDSQRFYSDYIRGRVHVTEPYHFDKFFFGIHTASGDVLTPNEWWQLHTYPALDLLTGFFYLTFIAIFVLLGAYYYFWASRKGTPKKSAAEAAFEAPKYMWAFFWCNTLGYSTYYWYAAAPPWYVAAYGLGPVHMEAQASQAGCVRFDQLLGTHFFSEMYGRAADVFGAIPSLHVAYPLISVIFAFRLGAWRKFSTFFYLIMCFSAVYLNHHYILDILWGSAYALLTVWTLDRFAAARVRNA